MSRHSPATGADALPLVRDGDQIRPAPLEDRQVAAAYEAFTEKGPVIEGTRLTVMTKKERYNVGEAVRVVHVYEVLTADECLYLMGPKMVYQEYVDEIQVTETPPPGEDPLVPGIYDGRVMDGPGVDKNFEVTEYRFYTPGTHSIQWKPGPLVSNLIRVRVSG